MCLAAPMQASQTCLDSFQTDMDPLADWKVPFIPCGGNFCKFCPRPVQRSTFESVHVPEGKIGKTTGDVVPHKFPVPLGHLNCRDIFNMHL